MVKNNILNVIKNLEPTDGMIGVEIEVEGVHLPGQAMVLPHWRVDLDGSLKAAEAFEYVMPQPSTLEGVKAALDVLQAAYKKKGSVITNSVRPGVHVHYNVQELTLKQFFTLLTCYYILEEVLTSYCGPNREGNHFCLRAQDAEFILFEVAKVAKTRNFKPLNTDNLRYASLNLLSLFKYGSIEFRAMRGTGNLDEIYKWCEIIVTLIENAKKFDTPIEAISSFSLDGEVIFLKRMLGPEAELFLKLPKLERKIREGARRAQIVAFSTDWAEYKDEKVNPFK